MLYRVGDVNFFINIQFTMRIIFESRRNIKLHGRGIRFLPNPFSNVGLLLLYQTTIICT
jgi:hypothetical protein